MLKSISLIKGSVYYAAILIIALPLIIKKAHLIELEPLSGAIATVENPYITVKGWFEGDYQISEEKYINANFGMRNFFVRLNNQIAYTFFSEARANGVIIGKDSYLYEQKYIDAYFGRDLVSEESVATKTKQLLFVQKELRKREKDIVVIIAPGKASFYPEYIPDELSQEGDTGKTNYHQYLKTFKQYGINYVDFKKWFLNLKGGGKEKYPLYPKTGIHWSSYGEMMAADSIISYMEAIFDKEMVKIERGGLMISSEMQRTDEDIEKGMNLLFDIPDLEMAYEEFSYSEDQNNLFKPNAIIVADSYFWGLHYIAFTREVFDKGQFWYYNEEVHRYKENNEFENLKVKDVDLTEELEKTDIFIVLCTEAHLDRLAFGIIDDLYEELSVVKEDNN